MYLASLVPLQRVLFDNQVRETAVRSSSMIQQATSWDGVLTFSNIQVLSALAAYSSFFPWHIFSTSYVSRMYVDKTFTSSILFSLGLRKQGGGAASGWLQVARSSVLPVTTNLLHPHITSPPSYFCHFLSPQRASAGLREDKSVGAGPVVTLHRRRGAHALGEPQVLRGAHEHVGVRAVQRERAERRWDW